MEREGRQRSRWLAAASSPGRPHPPRPRRLTTSPPARPRHATQRRFGCRSAVGGAGEAGTGGGTAARPPPRGCAAPASPGPSSRLDPAGGRGGAGNGCTGGGSVANKKGGACAARARHGAAQTAQQPACRRGRAAWVAPPPPRQGVPTARTRWGARRETGRMARGHGSYLRGRSLSRTGLVPSREWGGRGRICRRHPTGRRRVDELRAWVAASHAVEGDLVGKCFARKGALAPPAARDARQLRGTFRPLCMRTVGRQGMTRPVDAAKEGWDESPRMPQLYVSGVAASGVTLLHHSLQLPATSAPARPLLHKQRHARLHAAGATCAKTYRVVEGEAPWDQSGADPPRRAPTRMSPDVHHWHPKSSERL